MKTIYLRKTPPLALLLILFLFLYISPIYAHTLHVENDTYNNSGMANSVNGMSDNIVVRDTNGIRQGYARFDLSTLPNGITSADIEKATLRLFVNDVNSAGSIDIHRVTAAWDELTLSFNSSPTINPVPFAANVAFANTDEENFITIDITAELIDWINNPANDFGIALIPNGVSVEFDSKENRRTSHPMELDVALIGTEGPQGPAGPQGDQGIQGIAGNDGAVGATGATGPQGDQGIAGANGNDGTDGTNGSDGATGATGPQGDQGIQGVAGTNGTNGTNGLDGQDGADGGKDDADGVEITFTREFQYDPGTGAVPAIDLNGTALVISQTDPTVTLGGQARTVLASSDIPNTTPQLQQVIIDMPGTLFAGNHKLKLWNTQGDSEVFIPLSELSLHDGSIWSQATAAAPWSIRESLSSVVHNGKIWVIGGDPSSAKNDVWSSADGVNWTQETAAAPWSARFVFSSVVYDQKIWVIGGHDTTNKNDVWHTSD
jgi:hypothetical protein